MLIEWKMAIQLVATDGALEDEVLSQLTGNYNYTQFGKTLGYTAEQAIKYIKKKPRCIRKCMLVLESPQHQQILRQARHYWHDPKRINGGTIGLEDPNKVLCPIEVLGGTWEPPKVVHSTVRKGSKGETVKAVQKALGISADGDFGPGTEAAVMQWQKSRGLVPDGIVGKAKSWSNGNKIMMDWIKSRIGERTSWDGGVLIVMGLIALFATNQLNLPLSSYYIWRLDYPES